MYAVDTVRFIIPTNNKDYLSRQLGTFDGGVQYLDKDEKIEKEYRRFVFLDYFRGSYEINPRFKIVSQGLLFELSIPKWLHGTNYRTCWREEFLEFFRVFELLINKKHKVCSFWKWILKRVDLSYSFDLENSLEVQRYLEYFSCCLVRGKHPSKVYRSKFFDFETVGWVRTSDSFKFYNKYAEICKHSDHHVISKEHLEETKSIIRFEHTWRSKYIQNFLKLSNESHISIEEFDYSMENFYDFDSHIKSLFKDFFKYQKIESLEILLTEINEKNYGQRFSRFYRFLNEVILYGLDFVKASMSQQKFNYNIIKFRKHGIDLQMLSNFFERKKNKLLFIDSSVFSKNYII